MTTSGAIDWQDGPSQGDYVAATNAGTIRIAAGSPPGGSPATRLVNLVSGPQETALTMYDAEGTLVAELNVDWLDERLVALWARVHELLLTIERTPSVASEVADSILDELGPA